MKIKYLGTAAYEGVPSLFCNCRVLRVDIVTLITLMVSSFGLLLSVALIPLRKIIKLKPIDAIKNL